MNNNYNDYVEVLPEVGYNEMHMPVLILADTSGSMSGEPIQKLNASINRFAKDVGSDEKAARKIDISVVSFSDEPVIEQNWRPLNDMGYVNMEAGGGTDLSKALEKGVDMLRNRAHLYEEIGIEVKKPYLILITDGYGGDVSQIANVIKRRTSEHKMQLWILAVSGYDRETVAKLSDGKRVFELRDEAGFDFTEFFDFMAVSVKAVSTAAVGQIAMVDSKIGQEGSTCVVPDLTAWLND